MNNYTENNTSPEIWDSPDYPWGQDINRDIYKVEYDRQKNKENTYAELGLRLPPDHQHSTELAGYMRQLPGYKQTLNTQNTGLNEVDNNATIDSVSDNGIAKEFRVTNNDGSITLTRERQFVDNGIIQTKIGRIRLMPQDSDNGNPSTLQESMKNKLYWLSEYSGGKTVQVNSGVRTKVQNQWLIDHHINAAKNSPHLIGNAADISIDGQTRKLTEMDAFNSGQFNRVNNYESNQGIHVDTNPRRLGTIGLYRKWIAIPTPRDKPLPPKK